MILTQESIRRKHHLRSASWKRSIHVQAASPKRMKRTETKLWEATHLLQQGKPGYMALWNHIMNVSVTDLKRNYDKLNVSFDLWKKESDAQPYIPGMVEEMKEKGFAYVDQGALVVDVKEENDTKEIPPCMLLKSDGASLYTTTDLATIVERMKLFNPDEILYVVDKTSGTSLHPGIPLCKKDRACKR